ncbi:hypothetical protein BCV70DRAFT_81041 [Testicularia cyperi]|uniref:Uncharacterized protein n=1 Tax=Testicularia cyperi TaxID=1882483 RepID=A0A317XG23_9BASI|nr:hypothetical protein BCV70DRAFT_81041 [Testicularia cyperi]
MDAGKRSKLKKEPKSRVQYRKQLQSTVRIEKDADRTRLLFSFCTADLQRSALVMSAAMNSSTVVRQRPGVIATTYHHS